MHSDCVASRQCALAAMSPLTMRRAGCSKRTARAKPHTPACADACIDNDACTPLVRSKTGCAGDPRMRVWASANAAAMPASTGAADTAESRSTAVACDDTAACTDVVTRNEANWPLTRRRSSKRNE